VTAQVAADLRAAVDVLERDGWTQGGLSEDGRLCAIEAIWRACGQSGGERSQNAVEQLRTAIPFQRSIIGWNDTPGRTAAEVIAALRAAADAAEAEL